MFFLKIPRPTRSTHLPHSFPTRRSSDLTESANPPIVVILESKRRLKSHTPLTFTHPIRLHGSVDNFSSRDYTDHLADSRQEGERPWLIPTRSEEHTSELQSLIRNSYADFCLKKKKTKHTIKVNRL